MFFHEFSFSPSFFLLVLQLKPNAFGEISLKLEASPSLDAVDARLAKGVKPLTREIKVLRKQTYLSVQQNQAQVSIGRGGGGGK